MSGIYTSVHNTSLQSTVYFIIPLDYYWQRKIQYLMSSVSTYMSSEHMVMLQMSDGVLIQGLEKTDAFKIIRYDTSP